MSDLRHWPFYCEENVWHLCADPRLAGRRRRVVVISNAASSVALLHQRAGSGPEGLVVWDYHVLLIAGEGGAAEVWDLDSTLGLPIGAVEYLAAVFPAGVPAVLRPAFRLLEADTYRESFASDRRHMKDTTGAWLQPPPPWPPIGREHTLDRLVRMDADGPGEVVDLAGLRQRL